MIYFIKYNILVIFVDFLLFCPCFWQIICYLDPDRWGRNETDPQHILISGLLQREAPSREQGPVWSSSPQPPLNQQLSTGISYISFIIVISFIIKIILFLNLETLETGK